MKNPNKELLVTSHGVGEHGGGGYDGSPLKDTSRAVTESELATVKGIRKRLKGWGSSVGNVADFLVSHECKGKRSSANRCPIAQFLQKQVLGVHALNITVTPYWVSVHFGSTRIVSKLTQAQTAFTIAFDAGKFPNLSFKRTKVEIAETNKWTKESEALDDVHKALEAQAVKEIIDSATE